MAKMQKADATTLKSMGVSSEPLAFTDGTSRIASDLEKASANFAEIGKSLSQTLQRIADLWSKADWAPFLKVFGEIAEQGRKAALVEQSGWLPHHTTPFDRLDCGGSEPFDVDQTDSVLAAYYREQWSEVAERFRIQIETYDVDDEAKETFLEALEIHGAGHYRAAPRLLFPEIERVASDEFFGGKRKVVIKTEKGKSRPVLITRLKEVRASAHELPAGDIFGFEYGWQLFTKLEEHLYEEVGDDPVVREKFAMDPVPNRHGALHGIITYKDMKTSLNAIIMADFMFHLMSRIKRRLQESDESESIQITVDDC